MNTKRCANKKQFRQQNANKSTPGPEYQIHKSFQKRERPRTVLKNESPQFSIRDSFIRLYEGPEDRMQLNVNGLNDAIINRMFRLQDKSKQHQRIALLHLTT